MIIRRDSEQGAALIIAMMILLVLSLVTAAMALWAGTLLSRSQLQSRSGIGFYNWKVLRHMRYGS